MFFCLFIGSGRFFFNSLFILFLPKLSSSSWYFDNFIWDFDSFFEIFEIFFLSAQPTIFEGNDWVISEKWCFLNIWSEYVLNFWIFGFLDFGFCLIFCLGSAFCPTSPSKLRIFQTMKQCNQEYQSRLKIQKTQFYF